MKNIFITLTLFLSFSIVNAQSDADLWELTKTDLQTEYKTIIIESVVFTDAEAEIFWPIFNDFMTQKNELLDQKMKLLMQYSDNYDTLDDSTLDDLINQSMAIDVKRLKIRKTYYKKLTKALSKRKAGKLYQIDNQISTLLAFQIIAQIPIIE